MAGDPQGKFLTRSTCGRIACMTLTGALGITFIFNVDAANLFWISQLGNPQMVAAINYLLPFSFFGIDRYRYDDCSHRRDDCHHHSSSLHRGLHCRLSSWLTSAGWCPDNTAALAVRNLAMTLPSLPVMAIGIIGSAVSRAHGRGREAMYVTLLTKTVSCLIDPYIIFYLQWGLDGAALALVLSRVGIAGMALWFVIRRHHSTARPNWPTLTALLNPFFTIVLPVILAQITTPFGDYVLISLTSAYGDSAVAAWTVVSQLTIVAFGGIFALSGAISGIFSQNFGAGLSDHVRTTYRDALIFCAAYSLMTWAVLIYFVDLISQSLGLDAVSTNVLRAFTHIGAGAFVFSGALFVSNAAFNALAKPLRSTLTSWLRDGVLTLPAGL